jgi:ATP-binding cassette subfamily B protein
MNKKSTKGKKISYIKKCAFLLGENKKIVLKCCVFAVLSEIVGLGNSIFSAYYGINKALVSGKFELILLAASVILVLGLLSTILFHISYRISLKLVKLETETLRERIFKKAIYFDADYFTTHSTGAMINTIIYDIQTFCDGMAYNFQQILKMLIKISLSLIILTFLNPILSLILWALVPVVSVVAYLIFKQIGKMYDKKRTVKRKRLSYINEGIMGIRTVKALNLEQKEHDTFASYNKEHFSISLKIAMLNDGFWRIFDLVIYCALAVLFIRSYYLSISYGELFLFYQLFKETLYGVGHLAGDFDTFSEVMVSAGKIYNMLTFDQLVKDKPDAIFPQQDLDGDIKFENVTFKYPKGEVVLKDFNLEIKNKSKVAIVGKTGSGKSTIASLLFRFYEPTGSGKITIGGTDYTDFKIDYIHSQMGFVLQEPMLFDASVYENLRYAKNDATDKEIEDACKLVGAHEFIMGLSDGYNTKIGESGILLSNGQKQLLAFSRVVLKNPPIIIFDEATANIDSQTENIIQKNLDNILKDKTCLFIAHRLSTIKNVDKIIFLDDGKILEEGTHDELMAKGGRYADLYSSQFAEEKLREYIENNN